MGHSVYLMGHPVYSPSAWRSLKSWHYINCWKIIYLLEKQIHYSLQNSLLLDLIMCQKSLVNAFVYPIFKANFNIILKKTSSVNSCITFHVSD